MVETKKVKSKKRTLMKDKFKENPWILTSIVLGILVIIFVLGSVFGSATNVGNNFVNFVNSQGDTQVEYVSSQSFGSDLYEVTVLSDDREIPVLVTKDGKYWVQLVSELEEKEVEEVSAPINEGVVKSDKPLVQLFVMTHCPYGTQAEKGFLPMARLLEDVADMEIRFVHYFMHDPEEAETAIQVCIREEQGEKYLDYLECFLEGDGVSEGGYVKNGNDPSACMKKVGIDEVDVQECISSGKSDEYYAEDSSLSEAAGVGGSPTLVINGAIVSAGRSEDSYLGASCEAFNEVPGLCDTDVSTVSPSVYFGWDVTGSTSAGQC